MDFKKILLYRMVLALLIFQNMIQRFHVSTRLYIFFFHSQRRVSKELFYPPLITAGTGIDTVTIIYPQEQGSQVKTVGM